MARTRTDGTRSLVRCSWAMVERWAPASALRARREEYAEEDKAEQKAEGGGDFDAAFLGRLRTLFAANRMAEAEVALA